MVLPYLNDTIGDPRYLPAEPYVSPAIESFAYGAWEGNVGYVYPCGTEDLR